MSTTPATMKHRPTRSRFRSGSFRKKEARIALQKTPTEPTGVTTDAGAKPYATRLPSSPKTLRSMPTHQSGSRVNGRFGFPAAWSQLRLCACFCRLSETEMIASAMTERMTPTMSKPPVDGPVPCSGHGRPPIVIVGDCAQLRRPRAAQRPRTFGGWPRNAAEF